MFIPQLLVSVERHVEVWKLVVSALGFAGTIITVGLALAQFRRNEKWKRGEFIANELKDFNANPSVFLGLTLIDWGDRRVNLHAEPNLQRDKFVKVTRDLQWHALVPHDIKDRYRFSQADSRTDTSRRFTNDEARIRDLYDIVLRYFERFSHITEAKLVRLDEFAPYLRYWLTAIGGTEFEDGDYEWRCALITFIWRYGYTGVAQLCTQCGFSIDSDSKVWACLRDKLAGVDLLADCGQFVPSHEDAQRRIAALRVQKRRVFTLLRLLPNG